MPSLKRQNARAENRMMKELQDLAHDRKVPPSIRLKALDRIAILLDKFPTTLLKPVEEEVEPTAKRPANSGIDDTVNDMMRQLKQKAEESDAHTVHPVEGS